MQKLVLKRYTFHLLFWVMYAVFIVLDMQVYVIKKGWLFMLAPFCINLLLMALLLYVHMFLLLPLLEKRKYFAYTAGLLLLIAGIVLLRSQAQLYWDAIVWPDDPMTLSSYFKWSLFYTVWFIVISSMLYYSQKWSVQQRKVKNIEINQLKTELKYLRAQINPHFLFNGLNTIYGNIDIKDQKARNILLQFADLLRYNLYEADVDWVDLEKEAVYLQNYVDLQRARSNENLQIDLLVQVEDKHRKIAPLLFIPFIENAFKFSTRDDNRKNHIQISLQQKERQVLFQCSNTIEENEQVTGGIGLANVTRRLELLYKDRYTLNMNKNDGTYRVQLQIQVE